jgi:hypothetical protein
MNILNQQVFEIETHYVNPLLNYVIKHYVMKTYGGVEV